jgi:hypothetical protein
MDMTTDCQNETIVRLVNVDLRQAADWLPRQTMPDVAPGWIKSVDGDLAERRALSAVCEENMRLARASFGDVPGEPDYVKGLRCDLASQIDEKNIAITALQSKMRELATVRDERDMLARQLQSHGSSEPDPKIIMFSDAVSAHVESIRNGD